MNGVRSSGAMRTASTLGAAVLALSFAGPLTKQTGLSATAVVAVRGVVGASILAMVQLGLRATRRDRRMSLTASRRGSSFRSLPIVRAVVLSSLCFVAFIGFWSASFSYISVGTSVVIVSCSSFLTFAVTAIRRRKVTAAHAIGVCLAVMAAVPVALAEGGSTSDLLRGVTLSSLGAVFGAMYFLSLDRAALRELDGRRLWMAVSLVAGLIGVAATGLGSLANQLASMDASQILAATGLALVPHVIGQGLVLRLANLGRPVLGNLAIVGETIGASLVANLILGEVVPVQLAGSACLFCVAIAMLTHGDAKTDATATAESGSVVQARGPL